MTCQELIRKLRRHARKSGLALALEAAHGDHVKLRLGGRMAVLPGMRGEIPIGTFRAICKQLGIDPKEL
jgi:hypothetical protein